MTQTNQTIDTEKIGKIIEAIASLDLVLHIDEKKRKKMYELRGALTQQARALNPVFWLDGKKSFELLELYKKEMRLRIAAGFSEIFEGPMTVSKKGQILRDWKIIERRKWEQNRTAIIAGKQEMLV